MPACHDRVTVVVGRGGPPMEVRLLGPFEIWVGAVKRPVPGRAERALLAVLALAGGQAVATSTLIDALWSPGELPVDPGNALHLRVSKLRRTFRGSGAPDAVRREAVGYRLADGA